MVLLVAAHETTFLTKSQRQFSRPPPKARDRSIAHGASPFARVKFSMPRLLRSRRAGGVGKERESVGSSQLVNSPVNGRSEREQRLIVFT